MHFEFLDTQKQVRETAMRFFAQEASSTKTRLSLIEDPNGFDRALWRGLGDLGFLGIAIPTEDGGLGLGDLDLCVVAEMAGRFLVRAPFASTLYWAAEALVRFGTSAQKAKWLPRIVSGEACGSFIDTGDIISSWVTDTSDRLSGVLFAAPNGMACDFVVIVCGERAWLLDTTMDGVERTPVETIDPLQPFAKLILTNAQVETMPEGCLNADLPSLRNRAAVLVAFEQVGGADAALEMAVAYAKERKAFGRNIGSFQAVKHMLANMYVSSTLARSNAYYAAWALAENDPALAEAAAAARLSATAAYRQCAADAIQVHGGIGFTWDLDCHFHYRRANQLALAMGGVKIWEEQLLDQLVERRSKVGEIAQ